MKAKILDGKELAGRIKENLKKDVTRLAEKKILPGLAVIIVGNNPASRVYVDYKKKDCSEVGIQSIEYALSENAEENDVLELINRLNNDSRISGILIQLPLPDKFNEYRIIEEINPLKDVDCFHPYNVGRLMTGKPVYLPCTPSGIIELLGDNDISIEGKKCVIVNRSNIIGKPLSMMLLKKNGTITLCHSKTKDLKSECQKADILIVAAGKPEIIKADYISEGAVVIDVGVNRVGGKLIGDVEFEGVSNVASAITRVTGGVGPMTRAMLLKNTVMAAEKHMGIGRN